MITGPLDEDSAVARELETSREGIKVTIDFSEEDYRVFVRDPNLKTLGKKWLNFLLPFTVILLVLFLAVPAEKFHTRNLDPVALLVVIAVIFIVLMIRGILLRKITSYRELKKYFPASYIIHEKGMYVQTPLHQADYSWEIFSRCEIHKEIIRLYTGKKGAMLFPRKFFSETDFEKFGQLARQKVKIKIPIPGSPGI